MLDLLLISDKYANSVVHSFTTPNITSMLIFLLSGIVCTWLINKSNKIALISVTVLILLGSFTIFSATREKHDKANAHTDIQYTKMIKLQKNYSKLPISNIHYTNSLIYDIHHKPKLPAKLQAQKEYLHDEHKYGQPRMKKIWRAPWWYYI